MKKGIKKLFLMLNVTILLGALTTFSAKAKPITNRNNPNLGLPVSSETIQQHQISGKVTDAATKEPIPGVTIITEGSTQGATTDIDGKYSIGAPKGAVLVFSFMGYISERITVDEQSSLDVSLVPDIKSLDEVVVIGYGTVKKRDLTGSVVSIKGKDIVSTPTNNTMQALQGKIAGLDIVQPSGAVGSDVDVVMRGIRSIYGGNDPLYIVDGLPSSYNQLNPWDIESVDVLKDASSTAIYGSAGANGVVIITTKRGKEGKATINFDAYYGFSGQAYFKHGMKGQEFIDYKREAYRTTHSEAYPETNDLLFLPADYDLINQGKWIDWVDQCIGGTVKQEKYNLSISAGSIKTKVFTSFNIEKNEGLLSNENQRRYGVRLNLDQEIWKWAKMGISMNVNYTNLNSRGSNVFTRSLSAVPYGDVYDANGAINYKFHSADISPLADQIPDQYANNKKTIYGNGSTYLELTPVKGLVIKSTLGSSLNSQRHGEYVGRYAISNPTTGLGAPSASTDNDYNYGYNWDNVITFDKTLFRDHHLTLTGITSWSFESSDNNKAINQGQDLDSYLYNNLGAGTTIQRVSSGYSQKQLMSYAGRMMYSFKGKYLLTLTDRLDGSSPLAPGHQWDNFPSVAVAWRLSDESFMKFASNWLDNMKIRFGWGMSGNAGPVGPYQSTTGVAPLQKLTIGGVAAAQTLYSGMYANPNVGWEKSYNKNLGIDLGFFKNRIEMALEFYNTDTKDLLCKVKLPVTAGATAYGDGLQMWQNIGKVNNKGFEVSINTRNIVTKDFEWSSNISFSRNKEKVVNLPNQTDIVAENLFIGSPVGTFYSYKYLGIWSTTDTVGGLGKAYGVSPGYIKLATNPIALTDSTNDGGVHTYRGSDMQKLGDKNPKWFLGVNNTFTFKGFDLSIFTMVRWGQTIQSKLLGWYDLKSANQPSGTDYWTPENQGAYFPRPGLNPSAMVGMESLQYIDGSFIKIKNITLGYTFPNKIMNKLHIGKVRAYFTAYNPLIFAKESMLKGTDPENAGDDTFPLYKTYVCGINITF